MSEAIISGDATAAVDTSAVVDDVVDDQSTAVVDDAAATDDVAAGDDESAAGQDDAVDATQDVAVAGPEKVKALVESLKKTDPALAKEIKNLFFSADALKKEVPGGLPEIRQMKAAIEELGGKDGIEAIKAEKAEWQQIDEKFANGDATVLDDFAKFNPEGFAKIVPAALDKLANLDRDSYNHTLAGIFVSTLDSWRFTDQLERVAEKLAEQRDQNGNPLFANEIKRIQGIAEQYDSLRKMATQAPQKKTTQESDKIAQERAQIAQERAQVATEYVAQATVNYANKKYSEFIPVEARNRKFDVEKLKSISYGDDQGTAYDRFTREIDAEVGQMIRADAATVKKIKDSIAAGRKEEATKLSNAKFDQVYQKAVQRVIGRWATTFNPKGSSAKPSTPGAPKVEAGVKKLEGPPDTNLIDKTSPSWREDYMMHSKAKLKTGQRVTW